MSQISRRQLLRTAPVAAAALAVPSAALAIPEPDPFFAAIEARRATERASLISMANLTKLKRMRGRFREKSGLFA